MLHQSCEHTGVKDGRSSALIDQQMSEKREGIWKIYETKLVKIGGIIFFWVKLYNRNNIYIYVCVYINSQKLSVSYILDYIPTEMIGIYD